MREGRSHQIALAGVSSALSLIAFTLSYYVKPVTLGFSVLAAVFLMIPLTKDYWLGGILSYVAVSIISFFIGNIKSIPFIIFFGLYAIVQWGLDIAFFRVEKISKPIKYVITWIIKLAYFQLVVFISWEFLQIMIADINIFGLKMTYLILSLGGTVVFILYDILMHFVFKNLKWFINKYIK